VVRHSILQVALQDDVVNGLMESCGDSHPHLFFSGLGVGHFMNRTWLAEGVESENISLLHGCTRTISLSTPSATGSIHEVPTPSR